MGDADSQNYRALNKPRIRWDLEPRDRDDFSSDFSATRMAGCRFPHVTLSARVLRDRGQDEAWSSVKHAGNTRSRLQRHRSPPGLGSRSKIRCSCAGCLKPLPTPLAGTYEFHTERWHLCVKRITRDGVTALAVGPRAPRSFRDGRNCRSPIGSSLSFASMAAWFGRHHGKFKVGQVGIGCIAVPGRPDHLD